MATGDIAAGAQPCLQMAAAVDRVLAGSVPEASRLKLIVNAWMTAATVAMADALEASDRLGVPRDALLDVLADGPLGMPYALQKARLMTAREYTPGFSVELALKDIRLIEETGTPTPPLLDALDRRLSSAVHNGHAHDDLGPWPRPTDQADRRAGTS